MSIFKHNCLKDPNQILPHLKSSTLSTACFWCPLSSCLFPLSLFFSLSVNRFSSIWLKVTFPHLFDFLCQYLSKPIGHQMFSHDNIPCFVQISLPNLVTGPNSAKCPQCSDLYLETVAYIVTQKQRAWTFFLNPSITHDLVDININYLSESVILSYVYH